MSVTIIDYPRIIRSGAINHGEPTIKGSTIPVRIIARYYLMGMSEDEILSGFPQLQPADVFSALAFYFENKDEMNEMMEEYDRQYDHLKAEFTK